MATAKTYEQKAIQAYIRQNTKGRRFVLSFFEGRVATVHLLGSVPKDEAARILKDSGLFTSVDYEWQLDHFLLRWAPLSSGKIWRHHKGMGNYEEPVLEYEGVMLPLLETRGLRTYFGTYKNPVAVERRRADDYCVADAYHGPIYGESDLNKILDEHGAVKRWGGPAYGWVPDPGVKPERRRPTRRATSNSARLSR